MQKRRAGAIFSPGSEGGGELALLEAIRRRAGQISSSKSGSRIRLGIGDDCALLRPAKDEEIAITTDLSIESRHFRLDWHPPESVGHRTLARGLSDLAAMGARPVAAFLSLGIPARLATAGSDGKRWVDRFLDGLMALAEEHQVPLAGGDLAESPVALADIVLMGAVPRGKALLRSGAKPGDRIFVTGKLGGSAAELAALSAEPEAFASKTAASADSPHLYPQPRVAQGMWLCKKRTASAAMDLSDGLSTDLRHICDESHVAAEIDAAKIPLAKDATLPMALHGGEDYELLFTARPSTKVPRRIAGVAVTEIGRIVRIRKGRPVVTLLTDGSVVALEAKGWEHFAGR
ncbi:thiamine-phosphate kinase [Acidicapsa dinghuensis]|uniref:thiamine-phosphate kinase n=1 Tax=Acidicapsa dinghuensis TaxID=2218256 RepID=UPI0021E0580B|nr:thiamine-phosphate kinase [Acidicapsa dinghuensis]